MRGCCGAAGQVRRSAKLPNGNKSLTAEIAPLSSIDLADGFRPHTRHHGRSGTSCRQ